MISGKLDGLGRFRFWRNEFFACFDEQENYGSSSEDDCFVLEVMIPHGARCMYGLLGINFQRCSASCGIQVSLARKSMLNSIYKESLISPFEYGYFGLPSEYEDASIRGLKRGLACSDIKDFFKINICCAVFGEVSSSEVIFERIGAALAELLSCADITEMMIASAFGKDVEKGAGLFSS